MNMAWLPRKIVVPTDFSADSDRAVRCASELSREYGAPLTLIHVYDPVAFPLPEGYVMYTSRQLSQIWAECERRLSEGEASARSAGAVAVSSRLLQGLTAAEIVRFASDQGVDLIVMGTHGRTRLTLALLGSVAAKVVQTATCPVLTIKRERDSEPREALARPR
jgi:nucleotide-binding universal stress UspA family protein